MYLDDGRVASFPFVTALGIEGITDADGNQETGQITTFSNLVTLSEQQAYFSYPTVFGCIGPMKPPVIAPMEAAVLCELREMDWETGQINLESNNRVVSVQLSEVPNIMFQEEHFDLSFRYEDWIFTVLSYAMTSSRKASAECLARYIGAPD